MLASLVHAGLPATPGLLPSQLLGDGFFHDLWLRGNSATEMGRHSDTVFMGLWWFCVAWFVFLMALMVYFVIAYRRRPGKAAEPSSAHNTPLEIAWTIIPTICLVFMFFFGFWGYMDKIVAPGNAVEMNLEGSMWNWKLTYPNGAETPQMTTIGARPIPVFYMPAGVPVRLKMNSADVMHAFWVPDFRVKMDVLPNRYTSVWFEAQAPTGDKMLKKDDLPPKFDELIGVPYADHWIFCAEYCGTEHSEMAAILRVVPADAYSTWVSKIGDVEREPVEQGKFIYQSRCASCHSVDGSKNTGPTWKDLYGEAVEFSDGTSMSAEQRKDLASFATYVRESIEVPAKKVVKGFSNQMNSFAGQLKPKDYDGIIAYMISLSKHKTTDPNELFKPKDAAPPAETKK
jgi:cytochrome c oxidase subunit 2